MAKKDKNMAKNTKKPSGKSEVSKKFKQNRGLYIGSVFILVLVIIAFLGGDLISPGGGSVDAVFGYYDNVPIRWAPDNVFDQFRANAERHYQSQGVDVSNYWIQAEIWEQAFQSAVVHNALLQIMKRSNYAVPKSTVDRQVAQHSEFQDNGKFSPFLYRQMSESRKSNIRRNIQEDIIKSVYLGDFFDGLLTTTAEAEFIGNMASPERAFNMVSFNIDDYPESEYLAYAQANARLFDSLHLSKITINASEREARNILNSITDGTITFEEAARTQSQDISADRGGDMGSKYILDLESEILSEEARAVVFNLKRGEISPVLREGESWVIYRAEDELKKADFENESVMEKVRSYLAGVDRGKMENWAIEQAKEFTAAAKNTNFEDAALERNLEIRSFGPFPINYSGVELFSGIQAYPIPGFTEREINELSRNENFWKIAFSTPIGSPSEPFVEGRNVHILYPTEERNVEESSARDAASMYLSYWMSMITEQSLQHYFLNDPRMDDRFRDTFFKVVMP